MNLTNETYQWDLICSCISGRAWEQGGRERYDERSSTLVGTWIGVTTSVLG